jgi:hypothetical protein
MSLAFLSPRIVNTAVERGLPAPSDSRGESTFRSPGSINAQRWISEHQPATEKSFRGGRAGPPRQRAVESAEHGAIRSVQGERYISRANKPSKHKRRPNSNPTTVPTTVDRPCDSSEPKTSVPSSAPYVRSGAGRETATWCRRGRVVRPDSPKPSPRRRTLRRRRDARCPSRSRS